MMLRSLVALTLVLACSSPPPGARSSPSPSPSPSPTPSPTVAPLPAGWTQFAKSGFSLGLPPTWRAIELDAQTISGGMRSLREANPTFAEAYTEEALNQLIASGIKLMAFDFGTPTATTNMNVLTTRLDAESSVDFVAQTGAAGFEVQLKAQRLGFDRLQIGGRDAVRTRQRYDLRQNSGEVMTLVATQYYLVRGRDMFVITFTTDPGLADGLAPVFDSIMQTFQVL